LFHPQRLKSRCLAPEADGDPLVVSDNRQAMLPALGPESLQCSRLGHVDLNENDTAPSKILQQGLGMRAFFVGEDQQGL